MQHVQQMNRIKRLPDHEAQRFEPAVNEFKRKMDGLFERTESIEKSYNEARNKHLVELLTDKPQLHQRLLEMVRQEDEALLRGDPQANNRLWERLVAHAQYDPEVRTQLARRVESDAQMQATIERGLRLQLNEFHDLEEQQARNQKMIPLEAERQRRVAEEQSRAYMSRNGYDAEAQGAIARSTAMQDLLAIAAAAQQGRGGGLQDAGVEAVVADRRVGFDTPVAKDLMRQLEAARLRTLLDLQHVADRAVPHDPAERAEAMRNPDRKLSLLAAEYVGAAVHRRTNVVAPGYRTLAQTAPPPPPKIEGPADEGKLTRWAGAFAGDLEQAAKNAKRFIVGEPILEPAPTTP